MIRDSLSVLIKSASKLVFIMMGAGVVTGFLLKLLPVESFMILATAAFTFYFSNKGEVKNDFAGK